MGFEYVPPTCRIKRHDYRMGRLRQKQIMARINRESLGRSEMMLCEGRVEHRSDYPPILSVSGNEAVIYHSSQA